MSDKPEETGGATEDERSGGYIGKAASTDPAVRKTAKLIRRVGFTFLALLLAWTVGPIFVAVIGGLMKGEVADPVSHRMVDQDTQSDDCRIWGLDLLAMKKLDPAHGSEKWRANCAEAHPLITERLSRSQQP
jgi:hypothetical protein